MKAVTVKMQTVTLVGKGRETDLLFQETFISGGLSQIRVDVHLGKYGTTEFECVLRRFSANRLFGFKNNVN